MIDMATPRAKEEPTRYRARGRSRFPARKAAVYMLIDGGTFLAGC